MSRAYAESIRIVKETCPAVDEAFDRCISSVKEQTEALRDALTDKCQEVMDLEKNVADLEALVAALQDELAQVNT